jgi:hypothetical protein
LCALEVVIAPHLRGSGLSAPMLKALKARAAETGLRKLIVSVRPIGKEREPAVPMPEYAAGRREDGLLADGENFIPGGIAPVYASTAYDTATYVEPNVWMDHPTQGSGITPMVRRAATC